MTILMQVIWFGGFDYIFHICYNLLFFSPTESHLNTNKVHYGFKLSRMDLINTELLDFND